MPLELSFDEILAARMIFVRHADEAIRSAHQLRSICSDLGQYPGEREVDAVLNCFNGKVSFDHFARYLTFLKRDFMKPEPKDADTVRAYVALGGSNDRGGCIDAKTMRTMCRHFNLTIDIDSMLREADEDGSGTIAYSDFKSMWDDVTASSGGMADGVHSMKSSSEGVHFAAPKQEKPQTEDEYLLALESFLVAKPTDSNNDDVTLQRRTSSMVRRGRSGSTGRGDGGRRNTTRLPPLSLAGVTTQSQKQDLAAEEAAAAELKADNQAAAKADRPSGNVNDPVYRMYMMTDPVVVGQRRAKRTPRAGVAPATARLPPMTPRTSRSSPGRSRSAKTTPRS